MIVSGVLPDCEEFVTRVAHGTLLEASDMRDTGDVVIPRTHADRTRVCVQSLFLTSWPLVVLNVRYHGNPNRDSSLLRQAGSV